MGGVSDEEQPRTVPAPQAIRLHREQRALLPILQVSHAVGELRRQFGDGPTQGRQTGGAELPIAALLYDIADLPVIEVVHQYQQATGAEAKDRAGALRIVRLSRQVEPEYVHRRRTLDPL